MALAMTLLFIINTPKVYNSVFFHFRISWAERRAVSWWVVFFINLSIYHVITPDKNDKNDKNDKK